MHHNHHTDNQLSQVLEPEHLRTLRGAAEIYSPTPLTLKGGKREEEDYRFSGSSFFFSFFCLAGFSAFSAFAEGSALAAFLAGFFSGSAGLSSAFAFSTSSRMAIGALSPTRFCTWTMRVYPRGRVLK